MGRQQSSGRPLLQRVRIIACGMIAREMLATLDQLGLDHVELKCLPAIYHHYPDKIAPAAERAIIDARAEGVEHIFIGYADCGTGGALDAVCQRHGVERIAGPHCFSFYIGNDAFAASGDDYMTTFFMTDFLARQFDAFLMKPLGLDRHPELRDIYFGHYERMLYIAQTDDAALTAKAEAAARRLGLAFERISPGWASSPPSFRPPQTGPSMAQLTILYWRDIPAQVIAKAGRRTANASSRRASSRRSTGRRCGQSSPAPTPISSSGGI